MKSIHFFFSLRPLSVKVKMTINKSYILIVLSVFCLCSSFAAIKELDNREHEAFGIAVRSILQKAVNEFLTIKIVIFGTKTQKLNDELNEVMRIAQGKLVFEVVQYKKPTENETVEVTKDICKGSCFLVFESLEVYAVTAIFLLEDLTLEDTFTHNLIIKYVRKASSKKLFKAALAHEKQIAGKNDFINAVNVYSVVNKKNKFDLIEINNIVGSPSSNSTCNQLAMSTVNRFSGTKREWKDTKQLKLREKFNGCSIKYETSRDQGITFKKDEQNQYQGFLVEILKAVAEMGNYEISFFTPANKREQQLARHATRFNELLEMFSESTEEEQQDLLPFIKKLHFGKNQDKAPPLIYKELYFVIPKGELYTEWEKLFLAFDLITWCLIVATFAAAFATIIIINNFAPRSVRDFVFGRNVTTPALNVLAAFFGLGQIILPRRNFARFLLMLFIIWSMIFRTCYQGLLFEYLQGDGRKPPIKSIQELLNRNLTYFIYIQHCLQLMVVSFSGR